MAIARPRSLHLVVAAVLLVAGAGLQACGQPDPPTTATPAPATAAAPTTATPAPATSAAPTSVTDAPTTTAAPTSVTDAPATSAPTTSAEPTAAASTAVTPTGEGSNGIRVAPRNAGPQQPAASSGGAREGPGGEVEPKRVNPGGEPDKPPSEPDGAAEQAAGSPSGRVYTWHDGERTRRVILQSGLTARAGDEVTPQDRVVTRAGASAVVEGGGGQPVFRSESGGGLMALPGGVLLALDPAWSEEQVGAFLERNAIASSRVSDLEWLPNGYFIETAPGFPSLDLANELAGQDGVVLAAPNWWREVETR